MKNLFVVISVLFALGSKVAIADAKKPSVLIGDFIYVDNNHELNQASWFQSAEFSAQLSDVLTENTNLAMIDSGKAELNVIGRVTKLNESGDARVEIAFVENLDISVDDALDMVAVEVRLSDSSDAMTLLANDIHHMVYLNIDPSASFNL